MGFFPRMILNVFFMIHNVSHTTNDETNIENIGDNIVGAHYILQPTLYNLGSLCYKLQYFY